jgi:hypothetical protein
MSLPRAYQDMRHHADGRDVPGSSLTRDFLAFYTPRHFVAVLGISAACALVCVAVFYALSFASLRTDNAVEMRAVRAAIAQGDVSSDAGWLSRNISIGSNQWNDCLVLHQAVDRDASVERLIVSPLAPTSSEISPCRHLAAWANGKPLPGPVDFYHRYLHGHTVAARLLLAHVSVAGIRLIYSMLLTMLVIAGVALALLDIAGGRRQEASCFWLITFLVFSRWFGLESFGQSLAHGPSDLVDIGFLLYLAHQSSRGGMEPSRVAAVAAIFGALTIIFEFLTGGIPLGLALLIGGLPFAIRPLRREEGERLGGVLADAVVAFTAAITFIVGVKICLLVCVFGPGELASIGHQLFYRMGVASTPAYGDLHRFGFVNSWSLILEGFDALASGSELMGICMVAMSAGAGIWALRRILQRNPSSSRNRAIALAASNLVLFGWMIAFSEHTVLHSHFMDRILVWTISSGLALFALALMHERAAASSDTIE